MEKSTQMGTNRTGIDMSPFDSKAMQEATEKFANTPGSVEKMNALEREYIRDAEPVGSVPMPGTPKGMMKSAMKKMTGNNPEMFINKLGERLAFERSGVRIYDAFLRKCETLAAEGGLPQDISIERLKEFQNQEGQHFYMLKECLEQLGADPTAQTPDADVAGVASMGLMKVIDDPRTSVGQCLDAMLSIELTDNAGWDLLIKLAEDMGMDDMAQKFGNALHEEDIHLQEIRQWHEKSVRGQARMSLS